MTVSIPRIRTDRLLLREFRRADFDAFADNATDADAMRFAVGASDRRTAWRIFLSSMGGWVIDGRGWWAVALGETDEMVGTVGVFVREAAPDLEIGWTVFRRHWKNGYAAEAARAALDHAFADPVATRVIAYIAAENTPSVGVARKIGMTYDGMADFYGEPSTRYAIER